MSGLTQALVYVTLFLGIFFETFMLLTYLSPEARRRRGTKAADSNFPTVAVIVPCFNEETTIARTVESLKALDYPADRLEFVLVNDGSTDGTRAVMDSFASDPQIKVIHKENGGKHTGLNLGIECTSAEFVGCLDADSFVQPGALKELVPHFAHPNVAAVTASMTVHNPRNALESMQYTEYMIGVAMRHMLATINGLYVTPGPFSFYRRSTIIDLGGFRKAYQTEDMEMALRIQRAGFNIENAPRARVFTKAPRTVWGLIKQRTRWTSGFMRNAYDYRGLFANRQYGVLGLMVLPLGIVALLGSIVLFVLTVEQFVTRIITAINTQGDVPLAFAFHLPRMDWFFMPVSTLQVLALVAIGLVLIFMTIGKKISGAQGRVLIHVPSYVLFYPIVAPLWVIRSARDVAFGINRSWR